MVKSKHKYSISYYILYIILLNLGILFLSSCKTIPTVPSTANTTFTIQAPTRFNCYTQHQGTTRVSMLVDLTTYYYDGTKKVTLDDKSLLVNPNTTPFPATLTVLMPNDGTIGYWEVNMVGQQCSECANLWSDPAEYPYGSCPSGMIDPAHPNSYIAAKPRWQGTNIVQHYVTTINISASPFMNVPQSCGCEIQ